MEQILKTVDMAGGYYHHVGLKEGLLMIIDNDLEDYNCRIMKAPFKKLNESEYCEYIFEGDWDLTHVFATQDYGVEDVDTLKTVEQINELMEQIFRDIK